MKKQIIYFFTTFLNLIFINLAFTQNLDTGGDYSPAVWANSVSIAYGFSYDHIQKLDSIFYEKGLNSSERRNKVVSLIYQFRIGLDKDNTIRPTTSQVRNWLGSSISDKVIQIFTLGDQSPAVIGNRVRVSYGLSVAEFWGLYTFFENTYSRLAQKNKLILRQKKDIYDLGNNFEDLLKEFEKVKEEIQSLSGEMALQARKLLDSGKIEQAQELLGKDYYYGKKQQGEKAFIYAKFLELDPEKWREATSIYLDAVNQQPKNSKYINAYAQNLVKLGMYNEAISLYQRAIDLDSLKYGTKDTSLSKLYNNIGVVWNAKGKYSRAIKFYQKALEIDTTVLGMNHPRVAIRYNNLGSAWRSLDEIDKAIQYYELALMIDSTILGKNHPSVAIRYNNLGFAYYTKGENDRAVQFYKLALSIDTITLRKNHPLIAIRYNNLGAVWDSKGMYDLAIEYYKKALGIDTVALGKEHPSVAVRYNNLGRSWHYKKEYDRAIAYYEKALRIDTITLGKKHPWVAVRYNNLGSSWILKGKPNLAIEYLEKALEIDTIELGKSHPLLAIRYHTLGNAWNAKKEFEKAIKYYEKALEIDKLSRGKNHPKVAFRYNSLGRAYYSKGEYNTALSYYLIVLQRTQINNDTSFMLTGLNNIGSTYKLLGKYDSALVYLNMGIAISKKLTFKKAPSVLKRLYFHQGSTLIRIGRTKEAKEIFNRLKEQALKENDQHFLTEIDNEINLNPVSTSG